MVGLYIRLSRLDDDVDEYKHISNSVENQRKLLCEFLDEMPDLRTEENEEFIDDGWSGMNFQRPAFQRMLALIKKRTVTTVIVKDFSRFGRNYIECADYLEKLFPFLGTRFISVSDNYDSGRQNEDKQLEAAMKNIVNSYYSQDLSRKISSTFNMKRQNGEYFFCPPFGYVKDKENVGKILIDEEAAKIVRRVFALACEGRRQSDIAKILNRENVPTKAAYNREHNIKGKAATQEKSAYAAWTGAKVRDIIANEQYTGTYVGQRRKRVVTGAKKTVKVANVWRIPDNHPAIVDAKTFQKAQRIFTGLRRASAEEKRYQLKSKVICGNCGYTMAYQGNLFEDCYFYCSHTQQTGKRVGCPDERFSEEVLNARVFAQLKAWMMMIETACGKVDEAEQKRGEGLRLLAEEGEVLQSEFAGLQTKKLKLYESYSEGLTDKEEVMEQKEQLSAEMESIKSELDKLHEREAKLRKLRNRRKPELDDLLESVRMFENEPKLTCKMAETFVERVAVYDRWNIEVKWRCDDLVDAALNEAAQAEQIRAVVEVGGE